MRCAVLYEMAIVAGALHFVQVPAMLMFWSRVLRLGSELGKLAPVTRRIVHVLAATVVLTVLGTGAIVVATADILVQGGPLARALCIFLASFWALRAICQLWYGAVWPTSWAGRVTHLGLLSLFAVKATLYVLIAFATL